MELLKLMEDWNGFVALSDINRGDGYEQKLKEVVDLLSNARNLPPHKHEYLIREALTTSDFPYLFGDVLDRQVLASYKAVDPVWKAFVKMSTNRDFKVSRRFAITGGDQYLAEVAEKGEYLASERTEAKYDLSVKKYGRQFDISWESLINDDLGALKDTPERFARAAVRTEHRVTDNIWVYDTTAIAHTVGGALYSTLAGVEQNQVGALLTIANLEAGLQFMAGLRDANGEPIMNQAKFLVVPPALRLTAMQILTSANKMWLVQAAPAPAIAAPVPYPTANVVSQMGLTLIVDPYIPVVSIAKGFPNSGNTGWYLFADPKDIAAVEVAHLSGHERPEICMKASDKVAVGGGLIGPMEGDFATDNVLYRVRLVFGGCRLDWRATYAGGLSGT